MVRASFAGFSTALSALQANQKRLDIIGQNLSNMNTVGYTRQQLDTSSINYRTPVSNYMNGAEVIVGFGVHMDGVSQVRDPYLDAQYRSQMYKAGYTDSLQTSLDSLAKIFDESQIAGLRSGFDDIMAALIDMQDNPKVNDAIYESELRAKMKALTNMLNNADTKITEAEQQEYMKLSGKNTSENGSIEIVNDMLMQIGKLNRQIKQNQILGQPSLELMDERNVLLDELSSYIPIEVTYYKDQAHDGLAADGKTEDLSETYHMDSSGHPMFKKEWPDDLRVEMLYTDKDGNTKRLTLIEGTEGTGDDNYGSLELVYGDDHTLPGDPTDPTNFAIIFHGSKADLTSTNNNAGLNTGLVFERTFTKDIAGNITNAVISNQFPEDSGSIQASLDMLWKDGKTAGINGQKGIDDKIGYEYYRSELDQLARVFAEVMNAINVDGAKNDATIGNANTQVLFYNKKNDGKPISAGNIGINPEWVNGNVHVSTAGSKANNTHNPNDTILNMLEAMGVTYGDRANGVSQNLDKIFDQAGLINYDLRDNSFADFMNHTSTVLANDSYHNTIAMKTNVTVLNGIQNSRDEVSGVSLDEEASNMMQFMSAYNAASRLMTALDQTLDTLINGTGVVGR